MLGRRTSCRSGKRYEEEALAGEPAPRLRDKFADPRVQAIVARRLEPGERLPTARELDEQSGVSRRVIREAVRALAAKGVIDARTGGGGRVAAVEPSCVSDSSVFPGGSRLAYPKVHEIRAILAVEVAGLAAVRPSDDDVAQLREIFERIGSEPDMEPVSLHDVASQHRRGALQAVAG